MIIDLVFVCHNRLDYTRKAISSVLKDPTEDFRLTIWDNGSTDGTREWLKQHIDDRRVRDVVLSKENVGQTAAVNTVWGRSDADLLGKLDNDCLVTPGWTRTLAAAHQDIERLGVVACWHFFPDDFVLERSKHKIESFGRHQIFRHPWTCGTGLLIKRRVYQRFGEIRQKATTQYWHELAMHGYVNGFYYPLVFQEHMDDPKSEHSHLKDEASYQAAKSVTFNINHHGQHTLDDRWKWRRKVIDELLDGPSDPRAYRGWRRRVRSTMGRLKQCLGAA